MKIEIEKKKMMMRRRRREMLAGNLCLRKQQMWTADKQTACCSLAIPTTGAGKAVHFKFSAPHLEPRLQQCDSDCSKSPVNHIVNQQQQQQQLWLVSSIQRACSQQTGNIAKTLNKAQLLERWTHAPLVLLHTTWWSINRPVMSG